MKSMRIAAIAALILILLEAAWWASKNRPRNPSAQLPAQQQLSATPKPVLAQVNAAQGSAAPVVMAMPASSATASAPTAATPADPQIEQRLGPFSVSGTDYTLILKKKKPGLAQQTGDTVVAMEIRDGTGNILYHRNFPDQPNESEFSDAWSVSAAPLLGTNGSGLLVTYDLDSEPSAPEPESSGWYQVFGVVGGKFKSFSGPILVQGDLIQPDKGSKVYKTSGPLDSHSDTLNFKVWAHHFRLIYPVRVDWNEGKLGPALACEKAGQPCRYGVLPENERNAGSLTFVQLCPDASPCDHPERVVVKKDSKLELLSCASDVKWSEGRTSVPTGSDPMGDQGGIAVGTENQQLQVRIDGKEGWMHTDEDFNALGLPFEQ